MVTSDQCTFARLQTPKTPKMLQIRRGSFHQALLWAFAVPPSPVAVSLCCSSVATCRLRAHSLCPCCSSPLFLGRSSLLFARLQTPKRPKMLQIRRGSSHQALIGGVGGTRALAHSIYTYYIYTCQYYVYSIIHVYTICILYYTLYICKLYRDKYYNHWSLFLSLLILSLIIVIIVIIIYAFVYIVI